MSGDIYSFDTSALIDGLERFYPQANFPALWERIDELIDRGRLRISEEAWKEAVRVASSTNLSPERQHRDTRPTPSLTSPSTAGSSPTSDAPHNTSTNVLG